MIKCWHKDQKEVGSIPVSPIGLSQPSTPRSNLKRAVGQVGTLQAAIKLYLIPVKLLIICYYYIMLSYCILFSLN